MTDPSPYTARFRRYASVFHADLRANYRRDIQKWLIVAPIVGVFVGLVTAGIAYVILDLIWPPILHLDLRHPWAIPATLIPGFFLAGLIMQALTPDPNRHSTEEIVEAYHERQGRIEMKAFFPKLAAAVATVASGGSAALEGPSIYAGGAIGSWLWTRLRRFNLDPRDRRILLLSGAAAGMGAVFRAPLTGMVFALEMPYKDDLAHEALLPSLIASVVAYATLIYFMGPKPLFQFNGATAFTGKDLLWSALLGLLCGLLALGYSLVFRRVRAYAVRSAAPHWLKLVAGGALTALCGIIFILAYPGKLIPLGPNYEAVRLILQRNMGVGELVVFGFVKLIATIFSLGAGGVSAMFVPLFLAGGSFGAAFGHWVNPASLELFAAVGMAAFLSSAYKAPLTAVVFVAEATGGHSFLIPTLVAAAVAYAVSGDASVSGAQRLHELRGFQELHHISARDIMQPRPVSFDASITLREFMDATSNQSQYSFYPVCHGRRLLGLVSLRQVSAVPQSQWDTASLESVVDRNVIRIPADHSAAEALQILMADSRPRMLIVVSPEDELLGILTRSDLLAALSASAPQAPSPSVA